MKRADGHHCPPALDICAKTQSYKLTKGKDNMEKEKGLRKEYAEKYHAALKLRRDLAHVLDEMLDCIIAKDAADFNTEHEPLSIRRPKIAIAICRNKFPLFNRV